MDVILFAAASKSDQFYYMLCAGSLLGGFVLTFFASECLQRDITQTWISLVFLTLTGVTMLYFGFSSMIDFYNGHHKTMDEFLNKIEVIARIIT